jgi:hypothetical protein
MRLFQKSREKFDLVVSDMGREEPKEYNGRAGLDLLGLMRESGFSTTPVLIYTEPLAVPRFKHEVTEAGAEGITGSSLELSEMIHKILSRTV